MSNFISEIINTKINFLKLSYETNKQVNHQGIKGSLNEILLLELIKEVIPVKYKFMKGIVQDSNGFQSNESDIVIYDNEVLPALLFGAELGFIPSESVKYIFEVKSTLNVTELKSTINKFKNSKKLVGYKGSNVLFAFASDLSQKSDLERFYESEENDFLTSPSIQVFTVANQGYYFFDVQLLYLKDFSNKNDFAQLSQKQNDGLDFKIDDMTINIKGDNTFDIKGDLIINGINYDDLKVYVYRWYGSQHDNVKNCEIRSLLSGISNTLSKEKFGKYLMSDCSDMKIFSECVVDMWGNRSLERVNFDGYDISKLNNCKYHISMTTDKKNKIIFFEEGNND